MTQESPPSPTSVLQLITDYPRAQVLHVAVQLGLADVLADGPRSVADLAALTGAHAASLGRLVRALASLGVVADEGDGNVGLTPLGVPLRADTPSSVRDHVLFLTGEWFWRSWGDLLASIHTGRSAFEHQFGMPVFDYLGQDQDAGAIHHAFFTAMAARSTPPHVAAYDYGRFGTIVDVGGNVGPLLAGILHAHPGVRGVLFDLPFVVADAASILAEAGVTDRCTVVGGDFFAAVPGGADAYVLKYIIHDWDDARAGTILRRCREAMAPDATLLLIEQVLPERLETGAAAWQAARLDLQMLVLTSGGRERTEAEFRRLLAGAGFALQRVVPTASPFSILEAVPE